MLALAVADQRILRGSPASISYQYLDADGEPAAPAGAVTVGVTGADGTVIVAPGGATTGTASAPRALALASVNQLDFLTATFTDAGDGSTNDVGVEVAGAYYFSAAQARAQEAPLENQVAYPTADVAAARREVEDEAERICARAFVPRFRSATLDGSGRSSLPIPDPELRALRRVVVDGVLWDGTGALLAPADILLEGNALRLPDGSWPTGVGNVVVDYEHGWDKPPPDLVKAAIMRLRHRLNMPKSGIPDRAERYVFGEGGTFELAMPGQYKTGLPDVDAVYARYSLRGPWQ